MAYATLLEQYLQKLREYLRTGAQHDLLERLAEVEHLAPKGSTAVQVARCVWVAMDRLQAVLIREQTESPRGLLRGPLTQERLDTLSNALEAVGSSILIERTELTMSTNMRGSEQIELERLQKLARLVVIVSALLIEARGFLQGSAMAAGEIGKHFFDFLEVLGVGREAMTGLAEQLAVETSASSTVVLNRAEDK